MSISNNSLYLYEKFPPGGLRKAFEQIKKGQKGKSWSREIEQRVRHDNGTSFLKKLTQADLDLIERPGKEFAELRISCNGNGKSEWIYIQPNQIHEGTLSVYVSANTLERVMEIQSIIAQALGLELTTINELWEKRHPVISDPELTVKETPPRHHAPKEVPTRVPLEVPERVTLKWLWNHVPISVWLGLLAVMAAIFVAGFAISRIPWVADIIDALRK